jgi:hypothetical protein
VEKTIGIVEVAAFVAKAEGSPPTVARTRTGLPTKSVARSGSRLYRRAPSAVLDRQILALDEAHLGKTLPKAGHLGRRVFR